MNLNYKTLHLNFLVNSNFQIDPFLIAKKKKKKRKEKQKESCIRTKILSLNLLSILIKIVHVLTFGISSDLTWYQNTDKTSSDLMVI
jgi:hypothetical protein